MNKKIKLSVIVPVYNVEKYLKKCIESIIRQTYKNLEIILVDDGSPDNCGKICDEYAKIDSRIKVIHKKNGGLSDARNVGICHATGEFITFVDSDDWLELDMYEYLIDNAIKNKVKLSVCGVKVFDQGTDTYRYDYSMIKVIEDVVEKKEYMKMVFLNIWAAWDKIYHKSLFNNVQFPIGEFNEDEAIMLQVIDQCDSIFVSNKPLYIHFVRTNESLTAKKFNPRKIDWYKHCKENLLFINMKYPELLDEARYRYYISLIWCLNNMTCNPKFYKKEISNLKRCLKKDIFKILSNKYLNKKEKIRCLFFVLNYDIYCNLVKFLNKEYT